VDAHPPTGLKSSFALPARDLELDKVVKAEHAVMCLGNLDDSGVDGGAHTSEKRRARSAYHVPNQRR